MIDASKRPKISPYVFAILPEGEYGIKIEDYISDTVCEHYGVTKEQVRSKSRKRELVLQRHVICHLFKRYKILKLAKTGWHVGGIDHSSVVHAIKAINNLLETDKAFAREYKLIEDKL